MMSTTSTSAACLRVAKCSVRPCRAGQHLRLVRGLAPSACPKTLSLYATGIHVEEFRPLAGYTTLNIGGLARYLIEAHKEGDVMDAILFASAQRLPYLIIGRGSNMLFSDAGYNGVVIVNRLQDWTITYEGPGDECGTTFSASCAQGSKHAAVAANLKHFVTYCGPGTYVLDAGAGCLVSYLASLVSQSGLGNLEFAVGIPGSVGGAVAMNAGAHDQDMSGVVQDVTYVEGSQKGSLRGAALEWGYRRSCFTTAKRRCATSARLRLAYSPQAAEQARAWLARRQDSQPVTARSAGCAFRNPAGTSKGAGQLIDECGLKGFCIGGACVSTKHANFLVNANHASAKDFRALILHVQSAVLHKFGVQLEVEIVEPAASAL